MKYLIILFLTSIILWGCATTVDTSLMTPSQRLAYAGKLYNEKNYDEAVKEYQSILLQYPGSTVIDSAQYYLAMSRYKHQEYILGAYEFSKLIRDMPSSKFMPDAQYMLAQSYFMLSPYFALDQKYTKKSIQEFQAFIDFFPTNPKVPDAEKKITELNDKLAQKEYNSAYIYDKLEDYRAAIMYYNFVIEDYHETKYAPMAMYAKIKLLIQRKRNTEALAEIGKFIDRYPNDSHIKDVKSLKSDLEENLSAAK